MYISSFNLFSDFLQNLYQYDRIILIVNLILFKQQASPVWFNWNKMKAKLSAGHIMYENVWELITVQ